MSGAAGTAFGIEERIRAKLVAVGATSSERAVTSEEAHFDMQEQNWLHYVAGGLFSRVKKASCNMYYASA
jgi:hypothetical protein